MSFGLSSFVLVKYFVDGRGVVGFDAMCWAGFSFEKVIMHQGRSVASWVGLGRQQVTIHVGTRGGGLDWNVLGYRYGWVGLRRSDWVIIGFQTVIIHGNMEWMPLDGVRRVSHALSLLHLLVVGVACLAPMR